MSSEKYLRIDVHNFKIKSLWKKIMSFRETSIALIIIWIGFILSLLSSHFLTSENLMSTMIGLSSDGIIVVGMTIVLVSGGFDFSIGSVMSLSGVTAGTLYLMGINIWAASILAIGIGMICGLINGFFIGKIGLNPFITTLATMGIARGVSYVLTQGSPISLFSVSKNFTFLGQGQIGAIPIIIIIFLSIVVIGDFMMRKSEPLRKVYYIGSNEKAAILSGIDTKKVKMLVYIVVSILASIAGILNISRFGAAAPTSGLGAEASMRSILAAIIGGVSLSGGEGTIFGAVLGVILLNIINNGLVLLNISVYWQDLVNGIILILAVTLDYLSHKNKRYLDK